MLISVTMHVSSVNLVSIHVCSLTSDSTRITMRFKPTEKRYYAPPGISLWWHQHRIMHATPPHVMLYGESRLSNIQKWQKEPSSKHGPRPLDNAALMETSHSAVGGSRFATVHNRVRNINVPPTQPDQGNQWEACLKSPDCNPVYILVSLGSNDADLFGQRLSWMMNMQLIAAEHPTEENRSYIYFDPIQFYKQELQKLTTQVDTVLNRLEISFPYSEIIFLSVAERDYWDTLTLYLAQTLNWYVKFHHQHRCINLNGMIPHFHYKCDGIHYQNRGYHYFFDKAYGKVYEFFWGPIIHRKKNSTKRPKRLNPSRRKLLSPGITTYS